MAQFLTICRIDAEWGFRDVTGAVYGRSPDIKLVLETAQQMAQRTGSHVQLTTEAEQHYRSVAVIDAADASIRSAPNMQSEAPGFWSRLLRIGQR